MLVKMTSQSSAWTSSQVWLFPLRGLEPVTPWMASATSPASSLIFRTRRRRAISGETPLGVLRVLSGVSSEGAAVMGLPRGRRVWCVG